MASSAQISTCRGLAQETAVGLLSCRERQDEFGTKMLLRTYARDADRLGVNVQRAQSLLLSALTATAVSAFRQLANAKGVAVETVLQAESLQVSSWVADRAH